MKNILFVIGLFLLTSCKKENVQPTTVTHYEFLPSDSLRQHPIITTFTLTGKEAKEWNKMQDEQGTITRKENSIINKHK